MSELLADDFRGPGGAEFLSGNDDINGDDFDDHLFGLMAETQLMAGVAMITSMETLELMSYQAGMGTTQSAAEMAPDEINEARDQTGFGEVWQNTITGG